MAGSVQVDASWFDRDDIEELGGDVAMFLLSALAYSARGLTNGEIPRRHLRKLWPVEDIEHTVSVLAEAGHLEDRGSALLITDWHDFILSASEVDTLREQNRTRAERHRRHSRGDHSMCDRCSAVRNGVSNGVTHTVSNAPSEPSRAEPNRTEGEEVRLAAGADPDGAGAPPDRAEVEARLGRPAHPWTGACCPLPPDHPIHACEEAA